MQNIIKLLIILIFLFTYCTQQPEQNHPKKYIPKAIEKEGHSGSKDGLAKPQIIPVNKSKLTKILIGKPFTMGNYSSWQTGTPLY